MPMTPMTPKSGSMTPTTKEVMVSVKPAEDDSFRDLESGGEESLARPLVLISAIYIGMSMALVIVLLWGFSTRTLLVECLVDGQYIRLALVRCPLHHLWRFVSLTGISL